MHNSQQLVTQGYTQEEGIDYDEVFAPVARIEAISLFLVYTSFMGFMVYQMDVKSAFLYGTIEEEVYVCQPLRFEDPDYPDKVYKVVKALYGLHQAPRAWYETLAKYLLDNRFHRGKIDQTLFIKKQKGDILLVQVYVDDIIFGSTKKELCTEFENLMHDKFQMSSMGELTFFLGLEVKQKDDEIFISQDKYVAKILRKFSFTDVKTASTPMDTDKPLLKDSDSDDADVHLYRSMIGSLMYLTSSGPDIMFAVCACARFQVSPKDSHLHAVKRIFSDYAGASLDRKSTTGDGKVKIVTEASVRRHLQLADFDGIIYLPTTKIFEQLSLMRNTKRDSKGYTWVDIPLFPTMIVQGQVVQGEGSHNTVDPIDTLHNAPLNLSSTNFIMVLGEHQTKICGSSAPYLSYSDPWYIDKTPTMPYDSPLPRVNTHGSDEGNMQLHELMALCTKLSNKVESLEIYLKQTKQIYGTAFTKLIKKVKKLEKTVKTSQARKNARIVVSDDEEDLEDPSKQERKIAEIDYFTADEEVYTTEKGVSTAELVSTVGASVSTASASSAKDKGKAIIEEARTIQTKTKLQQEQERLSYEAALRLQEKLDK
ncbi:putative ribonuclease H-like domain-containing protein [Tanacetum coccineum]